MSADDTMFLLEALAMCDETIDDYLRIEMEGAAAFKSGVPLRRCPQKAVDPQLGNDEGRSLSRTHIWAWGWADAAMDACLTRAHASKKSY